MLKLPLVEQVVDNWGRSKCLQDVRIIGVQHILETTLAMFRALYPLGLRPEAISIIGKCYSTCNSVLKEMLSDGIDVSLDSSNYEPYETFDNQFRQDVRHFVSSRLTTVSPNQRLIILDDGGDCIDEVLKAGIVPTHVAGVEQTTAGLYILDHLNLPFPVVNIAATPAKREYESPMIAQAVVERILWAIDDLRLTPQNALVVGGGAIGASVASRLRKEMPVDVLDPVTERSSLTNMRIEALLDQYPLFVGCTGKTCLPHNLHSKLVPGTVLASASSSDREFDAVHLRKKAHKQHDCHHHICADGITLLNSGFPINFDGAEENIDPQLIQLTIALMTAGLLQAADSFGSSATGLVSLNQRTEQTIVKEFMAMMHERSKQHTVEPQCSDSSLQTQLTSSVC